MAFEPSNEFEKSLVRASTDAAHRPQFYRDLLASEIFIMQPLSPEPPLGKRIIEKGEQLKLVTLRNGDKTVVPFFSSLARLKSMLKDREEMGYLALKADAFFKITKGAQLVLNPGSDYGKE